MMKGKMEGPAIILGGLPVYAIVYYGTDDGPNGRDDWMEVEQLYWLKKDGTKGKQLPQHIVDRAEKYDPYFAEVTERVSDYNSAPYYEETKLQEDFT